MPEFIMNKSGRIQIQDAPFQGATLSFDNLDTFTQAYVEAIFWTECNSDNEELEDATFDDLAPKTLASIIEDCKDFQEANALDLEHAYAMRADMSGDYDDSSAGHDFWLTRNGHGAGFWDRGLCDTGKQLTDAAHAYGELNLYKGDDGKLYF